MFCMAWVLLGFATRTPVSHAFVVLTALPVKKVLQLAGIIMMTISLVQNPNSWQILPLEMDGWFVV